jgi:hypothetical protein
MLKTNYTSIERLQGYYQSLNMTQRGWFYGMIRLHTKWRLVRKYCLLIASTLFVAF